MTLSTLVALAEAVANLQKRVDELEKEPRRNVIVGGGGGLTSAVTSLSKMGETPLKNDVTLSEGANVSLTQTGQNIEVAASGGVSDHGLLSGLADDDHTQYLLIDGSRALTGNLNFRTFALIPKPAYLALRDPTDSIYKDFWLDSLYAMTDVIVGNNVVVANDIAVSGNIETDSILEKTAAFGVTVDGVLCKDGVIPESAVPSVAETAVPVLTDVKYPNALLFDGSRTMSGDLTLDYNKALLFPQNARPTVELKKMVTTTGLLCQAVGGGTARFQAGTLVASTFLPIGTTFYFDTLTGNAGLRFRAYVSDVLTEVARSHNEYGTYAGEFEISRAGDISLLDDKFVKIGKDSDGTLPTPDATYRGKMIRVEGATSVPDKLYMCMKAADDSYSWVQIATG